MPSTLKASIHPAKSNRAVRCEPGLVKRKRRPNVVLLDDVKAQEVKDWGAVTEQFPSPSQVNRIFSLTISEFGPGPHVVFVLRPTEQLSLKRIAQTLGLLVTAVKSRLRRVPLGLSERELAR